MSSVVRDLKDRVVEEVNYKACSYKAVHDVARELLRQGKIAEASRMEQITKFTPFEQDLINLVDQLEEGGE